MGEVVNLREPERGVWVCTCGCQSWYLYSDGTIECASCDNSGTDASWRASLADMPEPPSEMEDNSGCTTVARHDNADLARHLVVRDIHDPDVVAVGLVFRDGKLRGWCGLEREELTKKRKLWLSRKFRELYRLLSTA